MDLMHQRYSQRKIDFIMTLYPEALNFLLDDGQTIFPDVPVLALYLPQGFKPPETNRRIIPHLVIPDLKRTLEIALKLVPKAERVYVVSGTHPLDRWLEGLARQDFKKWEGRLDVRYLSNLPLEEILATVSKAPSDSIVFTTAFGKDVTGKYQTTVEVSRQLARVSKAPVFGFLDTLLGHGIVGGSLLSFEYIGTRAGELALDILRGTRYAENIPIVLDVPQLNMFDWRQLRHWNLSEWLFARGEHSHKQGVHALGLQVLHHRCPCLYHRAVLPDPGLLIQQAKEEIGRGIAPAENRRAGSILQHFPGLVVYCEHRRILLAPEPGLGKGPLVTAEKS